MGVQINSGTSATPAVTYDRVHLINLSINQPVFEVDASVPLYSVELHYRTYGVVDGIRYYKDEPIAVVRVEDFVTLAMTKTTTGDMTLINALGSIEQAVAAILSDTQDMDTSAV